MKVAVVTIIDYINYGNRLQNYAVQEVLKELGCEAETLVAVSPKREAMNAAKSALKRFAPGILTNRRPYIMRETILQGFTKKYIRERHMTVHGGKIPERISEEYDAFIVGSDQVWNPQFINLDVPNGGAYNRFLKFVKDKPKIAYAPSIAVSSVDENYKDVYIDGITEFDELSVREDAGAKIIYDLTGRTAEVLIDPTLMLDAKSWKNLYSEFKRVEKEPYILTYILGEEKPEMQNWINKLAFKRKLKVRKMMTMEDPELYCVSPEIFIKMIDGAELICTDSFHAAVFSILLKKPFVIIPREDSLQSMNSRIETLTSTLKIMNRNYIMLSESEIFEADYSKALEILEEERKKVRDYLKKALK